MKKVKKINKKFTTSLDLLFKFSHKSTIFSIIFDIVIKQSLSISFGRKEKRESMLHFFLFILESRLVYQLTAQLIGFFIFIPQTFLKRPNKNLQFFTNNLPPTLSLSPRLDHHSNWTTISFKEHPMSHFFFFWHIMNVPNFIIKNKLYSLIG